MFTLLSAFVLFAFGVLILIASNRIASKEYPEPYIVAVEAYKLAMSNVVKMVNGQPTSSSWLNTYPPKRGRLSNTPTPFFRGTSIPYEDLTNDDNFTWVMWNEPGYATAFECDMFGTYGEPYSHAALLTELGLSFDFDGDNGIEVEPQVILPTEQSLINKKYSGWL